MKSAEFSDVTRFKQFIVSVQSLLSLLSFPTSVFSASNGDLEVKSTGSEPECLGLKPSFANLLGK